MNYSILYLFISLTIEVLRYSLVVKCFGEYQVGHEFISFLFFPSWVRILAPTYSKFLKNRNIIPRDGLESGTLWPRAILFGVMALPHGNNYYIATNTFW